MSAELGYAVLVCINLLLGVIIGYRTGLYFGTKAGVATLDRLVKKGLVTENDVYKALDELKGGIES